VQTLEQLIESASHDMFNPIVNFEIAEKYMSMQQTASAVSFYLRCAEYGHDTHPEYVYASLIKISDCLSDQTGRENTVLNCILQAMQYLPKRPEAYFLLSRYYERVAKWQEAYTFAQLGLEYISQEINLPSSTDYLGEFSLLFEKAVAGWWIGRKEESLSIFKSLLELDIPDNYRQSIQYNITRIDPNMTF